ncbi:hypothetical protein OSB04_028625 [Centaurea solstitialis]|uniref:Uncharacterized protein n=1 Tax=Centaurea solstitialis TaxID=347529 RepID=A0AA38W9G0_9ASTR|nr:hypothetical protein OSB04_028625 [Centaurea solstitialis]
MKITDSTNSSGISTLHAYLFEQGGDMRRRRSITTEKTAAKIENDGEDGGDRDDDERDDRERRSRETIERDDQRRDYNFLVTNHSNIICVPIVLYCPNHNGTNILQALERALALKKSLSKTLTQYYPLAGTIKNDLSIDCNDVGASYAIALVRCRLNELLSHPDHKQLNRLLPFQPSFERCSCNKCSSEHFFLIWWISIGLCVLHRVVDGAALYSFLRGWTDMACGAKEVVHPNFTAPSLFRAKDLWLREASMAMCGSWLKKGKCITKIFVFDSDSIARLKDEATRNGVKIPTSVEVVTALTWKCALAASKQTAGFQKPSCLTHLVNLQRKIASTLTKDLIGNVIWPATAKYPTNHEITLHGLVKNVRESISKIDMEFVNKAQGEKGYNARVYQRNGRNRLRRNHR